MKRVRRYASWQALAFAWRATTIVAALALAILAAYDSAKERVRLSSDATERILARESTRPSENERRARPATRALATQTLQRARHERDANLANAARAFLPSGSFDDRQRRETTLRGLARWDVEESYAREFMRTPEDAVLYASAPRATVDATRAATQTARESLEALRELASDDALDSALEFLELCDEASESARDDWTLWSLDYADGDPIDSAGYVAVSEFERARRFDFSRRSRANAALFAAAACLAILFDPSATLACARRLRVLTLLLARSSRFDASVAPSRASSICRRALRGVPVILLTLRLRI